MADLAKETSMLQAFKDGVDMHSFVASKAFADKVGDCPIELIAEKFKSVRQDAKSVEFAIAYGGDATTIQRNNGIPLEEAQKVYNDYMNNFPGVKTYQDIQRKLVMERGYIILNDKTRAKAFIYDFEDLEKTRSQFGNEYWDTYREFKKNSPNSPIVEEVRHFFRRKSDSERQSINYKIQGTSAAMFKLASIFLYKYLLEHDLLFKVRLCIPAHDEWNIEVPEEIAGEMAKVLQDCMGRAGSFFCPNISFPAEASIDDCWVH